MIFVLLVIVPALLLVYPWLLYSPLLGVVSRKRAGRASEAGAAGAESDLPMVYIILSAHNEQDCIEARMENLRQLDYPAGKLRFLVGNDGSTDLTGEILRRLASSDSRIVFHDFRQNRGKVGVLKDLVAASRTEHAASPGSTAEQRILVFTDANTAFQPDSLKMLARRFDEVDVGGVCGQLRLKAEVPGSRFQVSGFGPEQSDIPPVLQMPGQRPRDNGTTGQRDPSLRRVGREHGTPNAARSAPEGAYWRWENKLKELESALDSCLGANGAIYAIRPGLFWGEIPDNTIIDDFVIGMKVREFGYRMVYEPMAVAEEELPDSEHEWGRRVRIGAGAFQALGLCRGCMLARYGWFAWMFWSHKVLRWFTPHLALTLLLSSMFYVFRHWNAGGWELGIGRSIVVVPVIVAALMLGGLSLVGGYLTEPGSLLSRLARLCNHFTVMQAALFAGFIRFCRGNLSGSWARTPR